MRKWSSDVSKMEPADAQSELIWTQKTTKRSQREPNVSKKELKMNEWTANKHQKSTFGKGYLETPTLLRKYHVSLHENTHFLLSTRGQGQAAPSVVGRAYNRIQTPPVQFCQFILFYRATAVNRFFDRRQFHQRPNTHALGCN